LPQLLLVPPLFRERIKMGTENPVGDPTNMKPNIFAVGPNPSQSNQYFGDVQLCNLCGRYSPWGSFHTCPLTEEQLREQIAQEILGWAQKYQDNPIVENCVRIARGQK
jgi:hypothetical protein